MEHEGLDFQNMIINTALLTCCFQEDSKWCWKITGFGVRLHTHNENAKVAVLKSAESAKNCIVLLQHKNFCLRLLIDSLMIKYHHHLSHTQVGYRLETYHFSLWANKFKLLKIIMKEGWLGNKQIGLLIKHTDNWGTE